MAHIVLFSLISVALAVPSPQRYDGEKVFRAHAQTEEDVETIKNLASTIPLDFWHPDSAQHVVTKMEVDFRVTVEHCGSVQTLLEQSHTHYKILIHNLQKEMEKHFDVKRRFSRSRHSYTKYNSWETIMSWTERMVEKNPKLVSRIQIGTTAEGRPMYLLKVGQQSSPNKAIFMDCGIHAREWISPTYCQWFVKEATEKFGKDKTLTNLLKEMSFYVLPVLNIDGYIWTWTKDRFWRKNRSKNPESLCLGTDLNRNFDVSWGSIGSSNDSCSEIYCGSAPASEEETKAVANFIRDHIHSIKAYLSFHSYSQMLLFPYGYTYDLAPNHKELDDVAKAAVDALSSLHRTKYKYGPSAATIYPTAGSSDDWAYEEGIKYAYTFELRDRGLYGFLLPEYLIKPTCTETMLAVKSIANHVLNNAT